MEKQTCAEIEKGETLAQLLILPNETEISTFCFGNKDKDNIPMCLGNGTEWWTGLVPNVMAMLDGLSKDRLVQEAMKLFGEMREKGNIPEVIIYTTVVEGFCRAMKLDDAKRIFNKMKDNGVVPNAFSYCVLIQGLCRDGRLGEAVDCSLEMLDQGWRPNVSIDPSPLSSFLGCYTNTFLIM